MYAGLWRLADKKASQIESITASRQLILASLTPPTNDHPGPGPAPPHHASPTPSSFYNRIPGPGGGLR